MPAPDRAARTARGHYEDDEPVLTALIQPLPDDVLPSARFLEALRCRLLTLPGVSRCGAPLRAA